MQILQNSSKSDELAFNFPPRGCMWIRHMFNRNTFLNLPPILSFIRIFLSICFDFSIYISSCDHYWMYLLFHSVFTEFSQLLICFSCLLSLFFIPSFNSFFIHIRTNLLPTSDCNGLALFFRIGLSISRKLPTSD